MTTQHPAPDASWYRAEIDSRAGDNLMMRLQGIASAAARRASGAALLMTLRPERSLRATTSAHPNVAPWEWDALSQCGLRAQLNRAPVAVTLPQQPGKTLMAVPILPIASGTLPEPYGALAAAVAPRLPIDQCDMIDGLSHLAFQSGRCLATHAATGGLRDAWHDMHFRRKYHPQTHVLNQEAFARMRRTVLCDHQPAALTVAAVMGSLRFTAAWLRAVCDPLDTIGHLDNSRLAVLHNGFDAHLRANALRDLLRRASTHQLVTFVPADQVV